MVFLDPIEFLGREMVIGDVGGWIGFELAQEGILALVATVTVIVIVIVLVPERFALLGIIFIRTRIHQRAENTSSFFAVLVFVDGQGVGAEEMEFATVSILQPLSFRLRERWGAAVDEVSLQGWCSSTVLQLKCLPPDSLAQGPIGMDVVSTVFIETCLSAGLTSEPQSPESDAVEETDTRTGVWVQEP